MIRCWTIVGVGTLVLFAGVRIAAPAQEPHSQTVTCYHLSYRASGQDDPAQLFAEYVAVHNAPDHLVRSGMGPTRPQDFWRMFLVGGTWDQRGDTLSLHFTNGFSGVLYKFTPASADSLSGQVWFLYDVVDERPPPVAVVAVPVPCSAAFLQGPSYGAQSEVMGGTKRLEELRREETERVRRLVSPLAGTYRFELTINGAPTLVLYGRTELQPANPFWALSDFWNNPPQDTIAPHQAEGYQLRMAVTRRSEQLPLTSSRNDEPTFTLAYFTLGETPTGTSRDSTYWTGYTDVLFAASRLIDDPPLDSLLLHASGLVDDVWFNGIPGCTNGRFVLHDDGSATLVMTVERQGELVLSVRADRISANVASPVQ